jgi:hypothetical protein
MRLSRRTYRRTRIYQLASNPKWTYTFVTILGQCEMRIEIPNHEVFFELVISESEAIKLRDAINQFEFGVPDGSQDALHTKD